MDSHSSDSSSVDGVAPFDFKTQHDKAQAPERELDSYFGRRFIVAESNRAEDKIGIDRFFGVAGVIYSVQYKCDFFSEKTGNAFIETRMIYPDGKKMGCIPKLCADWLIYYDVGNGLAYWWWSLAVKTHLVALTAMGKKATVENQCASSKKTYSAEGYAVPLPILQKIAGYEDPINIREENGKTEV